MCKNMDDTMKTIVSLYIMVENRCLFLDEIEGVDVQRDLEVIKVIT